MKFKNLFPRNKRVGGYLLLPGERGETKLSKARWSETERAKGTITKRFIRMTGENE